MRVSVNVLKGNSNADRLCKAFHKGIIRAGDHAVLRDARDSIMTDFDAALFWGFTTECQALVNACERKRIPWVFMDNGYWARDTHYKVTVNARHPTDYLMSTPMPGDRFSKLGVTIAPWADNGPDAPIVIAGSSRKACWSFGLEFESFERQVAARLRAITKRPLIYRPKSNTPDAMPIEGTIMAGRGADYERLIASAHCVIAHHSNAACDALIAGVPAFVRHGAAKHLALSADDNLDRLEDLRRPNNRVEWASNLAYCQWSAAEMADGSAWKHMKSLFT